MAIIKSQTRHTFIAMEQAKHSSSAKELSHHSMSIAELKLLSQTYSPTATVFQPHSAMETNTNSNNFNQPTLSLSPNPEHSLTLFALHLALLEKSASGLGTLGFVWATVVLLGGFAITLEKTDFWFITVILLIEGTRIFSRSRELEWQHQSTWSISGIQSLHGIRSVFRAFSRNPSHHTVRNSNPSSSSHDNNNNSNNSHWVLVSKNVTRFLYWLQLLSAIACAVLSSMRLVEHSYGRVEEGEGNRRNRKSALVMFYSLALAEAMLLLLEKGYWEWMMIYCRILEKVSEECELGETGLVSIRRFFYDAYSRSVDGSIFDGIKMDMVTFSMDLLTSNSCDEQLIGARVLRRFSVSSRFSDGTLRKMGTCSPIIERFVEMLNWKDRKDEEIRRSAAEILSKLAGKKQNSLRVAEISGAMESIASLLQQTARYDCDLETFNHLGLTILKKLARDHENCSKIGNMRGLLPKIIEFIEVEEKVLKDEEIQPTRILTAQRALRIVKMLASTTGTTGILLRKEIAEIVFTISNIRGVLRHGERHPLLQKLGIDILTTLALEGDATERIGATGGVLKDLFNIFFKEGSINHVRIAAGEALAMLVLESESNCNRILRLGMMEQLVGALQVPLLRVNAARILRNLYIYRGTDCAMQLKVITATAPVIITKGIMSEENTLQETMIGLAAEVFKSMEPEESASMFQRAGISEEEMAKELVRILKTRHHPPMDTPRIRRFAIELAIWMMKDKQTNVDVFKTLGMEHELVVLADNIAEVESFNIFSGSVGLSRHKTTLHSLIEMALNLLA